MIRATEGERKMSYKANNGIMDFLEKIADLLMLNFAVIIFSMPIVTAGAAFTAAHHATLKMHRDESSVLKNFWKAFKENLKQSTVIWLVILLVAAVSSYVLFGFSSSGEAVTAAVKGVVVAGLLLSALPLMWLFPLQSRFVNKISTTLKNAGFLSFRYIGRSFGMIVVCLIPVVLYALLSAKWFLCVFLSFGFSLPIYCCTKLYNGVFIELEEKILNNENEP
jgi:uncharacterized membrane protein YesL